MEDQVTKRKTRFKMQTNYCNEVKGLKKDALHSPFGNPTWLCCCFLILRVAREYGIMQSYPHPHTKDMKSKKSLSDVASYHPINFTFYSIN